MYNICTRNTYTLESRTAKARMITVLEAKQLGCTGTPKSCPIWMNNYLGGSTSYGGTVNDTSHGPNGKYNWGYWTMSAYSPNTYEAWYLSHIGYIIHGDIQVRVNDVGARAVVVVSK